MENTSLTENIYHFGGQSLGLGKIANARELGGYVLPDGRRIKRGMLLRGGDLADASDGDLDRLEKVFHTAKVFDFRTSGEVKRRSDRDIPGAQNIWMPAFDEVHLEMQGTSLPQEAFLDLGNWLVKHAHEDAVQDIARGMYVDMVTNEFTQVQYAGFLQNILMTPEGAVYWHCSQGKDRTGLGAAFILAALGADRKLIMDDYSISAEFYRSELEFYSRLVATEGERAVLRTFISVNRDYFELALDLIDSSYGSMYEFLKGPLCLSDEDMGILRERYLERLPQ